MKNVSTSAHRISIRNYKLMQWIEQLKLLSRTDILFCFLAGFLSRAELFGILKPFGLSFYAACSRNHTVKVIMIAAIFTANLLSGDLLSALKQTATIFLFEWLRKILTRDQSSYMQKALYMGCATAVTSILVYVMNGQMMAELLALIMEVILVGTLAYVFSLSFGEPLGTSQQLPDRKNIRIFCYLVLGAAFLLGTAGIHFSGVHLNKIIASLGIVILARHFGPGIGACVGIIAGLALSSGMEGSVAVFTGMYATAGMVSGVLQKSKWASGAAFFVTSLIFVLVTEAFTPLFAEMIIPVILFWIFPDIKPGKIHAIQRHIGMEIPENPKVSRMKRLVSTRLSDISRAFYKLGNTVEKQIKETSGNKDENISAVFEQLTEKVCSHCSRAGVCWDTKLYHTYGIISRLIAGLQEENGSGTEMERELKRFCIKSSMIIDALLHIIEVKRIEKLWQGITEENKRFIPDQIYSLSEFLAALSGEVFKGIEYFGDEGKKIEKELRRNGYPVSYTEVQKKDGGRFAAEIHIENCKGSKNCLKEIERIVTGILGVSMQDEGERCKNAGRDHCILYLSERESLGVTTGVARMRKNNASVSGDSFTFLKTQDGKYVVAISDGMGSGVEANRLSEMAVVLLEQLLDCGLSVRYALGLINMIMRIKGVEKYATLDISVIDLYTGDTEFYKMGAVPSLIRNGKTLDFIQIDNLPAGLQGENAIHPEKRKITEGEFIIMMSDGVYECFRDERGKVAIEKVIKRENTLNPQELAEKLLKSACNGRENAPDDMTVLVAKLWHKAG